ncbi:hypothetical protein GCM10008094_09710 [Aidingimonas halophila]|nr:hypothetical protein GCM10008094_09710 [Aidingimonas halophila]
MAVVFIGRVFGRGLVAWPWRTAGAYAENVGATKAVKLCCPVWLHGLAVASVKTQAFRLQGNSAHTFVNNRLFGVLVPGAIGQVGARYQGAGIQHWMPKQTNG